MIGRIVTEAGGPANQAGVYFQNTIAALYLGRLLDLRQRPTRERIVEVRVEAPAHVDDIVVRFADGRRRYIQAKRSLTAGSDAWNRLWCDFGEQLATAGSDDRLVLVLGDHSELGCDLRECCERTAGAESDDEYLARLTNAQRHFIRQIMQCGSPHLTEVSPLRALLARTDVEMYVDRYVERDHAPQWLPECSATAEHLLAILRDLVGGGSRTRVSFDARELRRLLKEVHDVDLTEPPNWGASVYRAVVWKQSRIEVPGTGFAAHASEAFVWPQARPYDRTRRADFEDDLPTSTFAVRLNEVDLRHFPTTGLERSIVIAGPGFGKSALVRALQATSIKRGLLPVSVSIPELSSLDVTIGEFLQNHVNPKFEVKIDWIAAAESGLLVLFLDGLDEIPGERRPVLWERISTFCHRYPDTPWLLTVRDAAALPAPAGATLVELEPLRDEDVALFGSIYCRDNSELGKALIRHLDGRPDLRQLARIPLFLALLFTSIRALDDLPNTRGQLIEAYLELLFHPAQYKTAQSITTDASLLRRIAQEAAFHALQREEIGLTNRLLDDVARRSGAAAGLSSRSLIDNLVSLGVVRRSSLSRFEFPFPIVQEYLAAQHIVSTRPEEVASLLGLTAKRPWAQTLQFVLELHDSPGQLCSAILEATDDAFRTNLRLIARCVSNGMRLPSDLHAQVGRELAAFWPKASWGQRSRIGELITDAFCKPLYPEIRAQLVRPWSWHCGAAKAITQISDVSLTREAFHNFLSGDLEHAFLHDLQPLVSALGDEVLDAYVQRAREPRTTQREIQGIATLISQLDALQLSVECIATVQRDQSLPVAIRLAVLSLGSETRYNVPDAVIHSALSLPDYSSRSLAFAALARRPDPLQSFIQLLQDENWELKDRLDFIWYVVQALPEDQQTAQVGRILQDASLDPHIRLHLLVFAASRGEFASMETLVDSLDTLPVDLAGAMLSVFGHHQSRELVQRAVLGLKRRSLSPEDRVRLGGGLRIGMTFLLKMGWLGTGVLDPGPAHPGLDIARGLLEEWVTNGEYSPLDALRLDMALADLGAREAIERLGQRILHVVVTNAPKTDSNDPSAELGNALDRLLDNKGPLELESAVKIFRWCSYNGASRAAKMIAARGNKEAFEQLVELFNSSDDSHLRGYILEQLEPISSRLGVRVNMTDHELTYRFT